MSPRSRNRGSKRAGKSRQKRQQGGGGANLGRSDAPGFWGDPARLPSAQPDVRITEDPPAVVRSLGPPPLPGHETIAEHYFAAVYDRAVTVAGALAAVGGLIGTDELVEDDE